MDDDRLFKALADGTRRHLLDRLFERDGRTLGYLSPVPIPLIHDRWIELETGTVVVYGRSAPVGDSSPAVSSGTANRQVGRRLDGRGRSSRSARALPGVQ